MNVDAKFEGGTVVVSEGGSYELPDGSVQVFVVVTRKADKGNVEGVYPTLGDANVKRNELDGTKYDDVEIYHDVVR